MRLPVAPLSEETRPGLALLIESYAARMEATVDAWAASILEQDLAVRAGGLTERGGGSWVGGGGGSLVW